MFSITGWVQVAQWYSETLRVLPTHRLWRHMTTDVGRPLLVHASNIATVPHQLETLRDTLQLIADVTVRKEIGQLVYRYTLSSVIIISCE